MKDVLCAALAVPALKVADVSFNTEQIHKRIDEACAAGATLVAFPELSLTGASCGDLFLSDMICEGAAGALCELASAVPPQMVAVVGAPLAVNGQIYNCAVVLVEGQILGAVPKSFLSPKNGEERYFASGADLSVSLASVGCFTFPIGNELLFRAKQDGTTFAENALIKARAACAALGEMVIADDSGLCVDALGGAPGVYSARYCGYHGNDEENRKVLLKNMEGITNRRAHFTSAIALVCPDGNELVAEGHTYGEILHEETGDGGFGYDCLFFNEDLQKSFGVATAEEKNSVSHRFRALQKMWKMWQEQGE